MGKNEVYLHVGNSGALFKVTDEKGPTLVVQTSAHGNLHHEFKLFTDREGLRTLGTMLINAADEEFKTDECICPAKLVKQGVNGQTGVQTK